MSKNQPAYPLIRVDLTQEQKSALKMLFELAETDDEQNQPGMILAQIFHNGMRVTYVDNEHGKAIQLLSGHNNYGKMRDKA